MKFLSNLPVKTLFIFILIFIPFDTIFCPHKYKKLTYAPFYCCRTRKICILKSRQFFCLCFEISLLLIDNKQSQFVKVLIKSLTLPPNICVFGPLQCAFSIYKSKMWKHGCIKVMYKGFPCECKAPLLNFASSINPR